MACCHTVAKFVPMPISIASTTPVTPAFAKIGLTLCVHLPGWPAAAAVAGGGGAAAGALGKDVSGVPGVVHQNLNVHEHGH